MNRKEGEQERARREFVIILDFHTLLSNLLGERKRKQQLQQLPIRLLSLTTTLNYWLEFPISDSLIQLFLLSNSNFDLDFNSNLNSESAVSHSDSDSDSNSNSNSNPET